MRRLVGKIVVTRAPDFQDETAVVYNYANNIEVESGYDQLTDMATIKFPRKAKYNNINLTVNEDSLFKRGDKVVVYLGYFPNLIQEFTGYVSDVITAMPLEIKCQDANWLLKQHEIKKYTGSGLSLSQLLTAILPDGIEFEAADVNVGDWRIYNQTASQILDILNDRLGLFSWFRNGVLYSGLPTVSTLQKTVQFRFERDIIDDSELEYLRQEDVKIKVVAKSINSDNTKEEITRGDEDGAIRTITAYNLGTADLITLAEQKLIELKYEGYRGSFLTFGAPSVNHGDIAELASTVLPERGGSYKIKKVSKNWGVDGYRQRIELEAKVG